MRLSLCLALCSVAVFLLGGCEEAWNNPFEMSSTPDYRIKLMTRPDGRLEAIPPECPSWRTENNSPWQNDPWPQYGCANARNLAAMVEQPEDLIVGRALDPASGSRAAYSIKRYNEGKTAALIDPNAKAPAQVFTGITPGGETGGGGQGGASQ